MKNLSEVINENDLIYEGILDKIKSIGGKLLGKSLVWTDTAVKKLKKNGDGENAVKIKSKLEQWSEASLAFGQQCGIKDDIDKLLKEPNFDKRDESYKSISKKIDELKKSDAIKSEMKMTLLHTVILAGQLGGVDENKLKPYTDALTEISKKDSKVAARVQELDDTINTEAENTTNEEENEDEGNNENIPDTAAEDVVKDNQDQFRDLKDVTGVEIQKSIDVVKKYLQVGEALKFNYDYGMIIDEGKSTQNLALDLYNSLDDEKKEKFIQMMVYLTNCVQGLTQLLGNNNDFVKKLNTGVIASMQALSK